MKYKIQSRTIFGWMDIMGHFDTIEEAQVYIPKIQYRLSSPFYPTTSVLKIVEKEEKAINNYFVYDKNNLY